VVLFTARSDNGLSGCSPPVWVVSVLCVLVRAFLSRPCGVLAMGGGPWSGGVLVCTLGSIALGALLASCPGGGTGGAGRGWVVFRGIM
jgi:hypothetical protein